MFVILPGRQPLNFYLCSSNPNMWDLDSEPPKLNWQILVIQTISIFIHIVFNARIKMYNLKLQKTVPVMHNTERAKQFNLTLIESRVITDFATNLFCLLVIGSIATISSIVNNMSLTKVSDYPNYHIVYVFNLMFPPLVTGTIYSVYYARHEPLRKAVRREILNKIRSFIYSQGNRFKTKSPFHRNLKLSGRGGPVV